MAATTRRVRHRHGTALALALVLAACGGRPPIRESATIAISSSLLGLDPHMHDKLGTATVLSNLYEGLVGADGDLRIRPALAESWGSPDALTWRFHLRPSVVFHSGRPLRARDVVHSFERLLGDPTLEMSVYVNDVERVTAVDEMTVDVRTRVPSRILLNKLRNVAIVPQGAAAETLATTPDGTGPYRLVSWTPGEGVHLRRHEAWWGRTPALRDVHLLVGRDAEQIVEGLRSGRYDLVRYDAGRLPPLEPGSRFKVLHRENLFVKYVGVDVSRPPFDDVRVRRAASLAIDRGALVRRLSVHAVPAGQLVPRVVFGFDPRLSVPAPDPDRARALLQQAGHAEGFATTVHARPLTAEAAAIVAEALTGVGIVARAEEHSNDEFNAIVGRGQAPLWVNSVGCASGDASDLYDAALHSPDVEGRFGTRNFGGYSDPDLDALIEASAGIQDAALRRDRLQEIMRRAVEAAVLVPLYNDLDVYAVDATLSWTPRSDSTILIAEIGVAP